LRFWTSVSPYPLTRARRLAASTEAGAGEFETIVGDAGDMNVDDMKEDGDPLDRDTN